MTGPASTTASELYAFDGGSALGVAARCWRLHVPLRTLSTAPVGGGTGRRDWVLNLQVARDYGRRDLDAHVSEVAGALGLRGCGVGMLTAAPVASVTAGEEDGVRAEATVGLDWPVWAAAPDEAGHALSPTPGPSRTSNPFVPGTVNVVVFVPVPHTEAALANLLCTVTEAKVQALAEGGVPGTGTASDAVTVLCPEGRTEEPFGGPRSAYGARVARCAYDAIRAGMGRP